MRIVDDVPLELAHDRWLRGESALPLVRLLLEREQPIEASVVARAALEREDCPDAAEIEELLYTIGSPPADWAELLEAFAARPSIERWREMLTFVPSDLRYQRLRNSIRRLRGLGVDANLLFLCACEYGMTPDAIQLVEEGLVDPDVIIGRAASSGPARATYLGLAAIAAFRRHDMVGVVRLLREAAAYENELCFVWPHILFIRGLATTEQIAVLDSAGIPH